MQINSLSAVACNTIEAGYVHAVRYFYSLFLLEDLFDLIQGFSASLKSKKTLSKKITAKAKFHLEVFGKLQTNRENAQN